MRASVSELDRLLTNEPVLPDRLTKTLVSFGDLDPHEQDYINAKRGSMPPDHLAESLRQYRAIKQADRKAEQHPSENASPTPLTESELDRLLANEPQLPFEPLHRKAGEPPVAHLSREGAPYQPYFGHMPAEAVTPHIEHPPTTRFKEGRADLPFDQLKLSAGGLYNKASDLYKNMIGSVADPEVASQLPFAAGISRLQKPKLSAVKQPELDRLLEPEQTATKASQDVPPPPQAPTGAQVPAVRSGLPPARIEPPEPPERLGADGTWRYEPWRQNYDVHVADWRDPNITMLEKLRRRLPADYGIATKHPESPVIGTLDRPATELMNWTGDFVKSPEMRELSKLDADLFVTEEAKAHAMWEQSRKASMGPEAQIAPRPGQVGMQIVGQNPAASFEEIMGTIDPRVRPWFELFRQRMAIDQQSRAILGLEALDEVPYPYLPRIGQADWDRLMMVQRGDRGADAVAQLSTTIKGFQQARTYPTMSKGLENGMLYEDPKRAILMRLVLSKQMEYTAQMMQELRGKVMFETRDAAKGELLRRRNLDREVGNTIADPTHTHEMVHHGSLPRGAGTRSVTPIGEPVAVTGLPGPADQIWYVPSKEEALALFQHLKGHQSGGFWGEASAVANQLFRNPNLMNPAPHVIKNMGYKYIIAATGLGQNPLGAMGSLAGYTARMPFDFFGAKAPLVVGRLSRDASEYAHNLNPSMIAEFNREMPFSRTAATAYENLKPFLERSQAWSTAQLVGKYLSGNAWSSKYIFSKADPAMKYSLWKMYREKGMSGTAAANQVNIDLIRYTLRSDLTDTWKNVPLNFFVPWRVGTIMATAKQLSTQPWQTLALQQATKIPAWAMTRPFKTSLLIGAIMLGREAYYRDTGKTFHLPIDYLDTPITHMVSNPATIPYVAASMYLMGPGADPVRLAGNLKDMFGVLKGTEDVSKVMEMYWGIAQLYGSGKEFHRFAKSVDEHGFAGADYGALAHVVSAAAFAEYSNYSYQPKHLEHFIPESALPFNPAVKRNLAENEARAAAAELRQPNRDLHKEKIRELQERRVRP